jgi:uncharacterized membrane protein
MQWRWRSGVLASQPIATLMNGWQTGYVLARVLHVLGVVLWIGGVAMVTTVLLPAVARLKHGADGVEWFEAIEGRFARQARWTILTTGLSGFYMLAYLHAWHRYGQAAYWWITAMTAVWAVFTLMLFVLEPLVLHRWFRARAVRNPGRTVALIQVMHWILLLASLVTVAGAVAGAHGWLLFT